MSRLKKVLFFFNMLFDKVENWSNIFGISLLIVVMFIITADVLFRYIVGKSIMGVVEISEVLLVVIFYTALSYCQKERGHIRLDILVERLKGKSRQIVEIIALLAAMCILVPMLYQSVIQAHQSIQIKEFSAGNVAFPIWPIKIVVSYGLCLICIRIVRQITQHFQNLIKL